jgi:hypothetical protein
VTTQIVHRSDCSLHNQPAYLPDPCDCGANPGQLPDRLDCAIERTRGEEVRIASREPDEVKVWFTDWGYEGQAQFVILGADKQVLLELHPQEAWELACALMVVAKSAEAATPVEVRG